MRSRFAAASFALVVACSSEDSASTTTDAATPQIDAGAPPADVDASDAGADVHIDARAPDASVAHRHARCGWIGAGDANGVDTFVAHADWFDAVHPDWYALATDGVSLRTIAGVDDAALVAAARAHDVLLVPM